MSRLVVPTLGSQSVLAPLGRVVLVWLGCVLAVGCAPSFQGAPTRVFTPSSDAAELVRLAGPSQFATYEAADTVKQKRLRNQIIYARLYAIDLAYSQYELRLTRERQSVGFLGTLAQLGISTTGTVFGGEELKTILHATETGVTGLKEGYDKNILIDRTIDSLQKTMRANRQHVKAKITDRTTFDVSAYPLELAMSDVEEYYRAGTITAALIGISEEAGNALAIANHEEQQVLTVQFAQTEYLPRLRKYFRESEENRQKMAGWLKANKIDLDPVTFMTSGISSEQAEMVKELGVP